MLKQYHLDKCEYLCGVTPFMSSCHAFSCIGDLKRLLCDVEAISVSSAPGHKAITRTPVKL